MANRNSPWGSCAESVSFCANDEIGIALEQDARVCVPRKNSGTQILICVAFKLFNLQYSASDYYLQLRHDAPERERK